MKRFIDDELPTLLKKASVQATHNLTADEITYKIIVRADDLFASVIDKQQVKEAIENELIACQEEITSKHSCEWEREWAMACFNVLKRLLKKLGLEREENDIL